MVTDLLKYTNAHWSLVYEWYGLWAHAAHFFEWIRKIYTQEKAVLFELYSSPKRSDDAFSTKIIRSYA